MSLIISGLVLVVGACVQGTVGFGMNMLAVPIIALYEPDLVPGPLLISTFAVTVPSAIAEWHAVDVRELGVALLGRIPGNILGATAVALLPLRWLTGLIGASILAGIGISAYSRRRSHSPEREPTVRTSTLILTATASGFMGTATTVGGPPMALLYAEHGAAKLRATLAAFFSMGLIFSVALLAFVGEVSVAGAKNGLLLAPFVLIGWGASRFTKQYLTDVDRLRATVMLISGAAALVLIAQSFSLV